MEHKTTIDGYTVEVTTGYADDSGTNGCWISKGNFNSSLAVLEDFGMLANQAGEPVHTVKQSTIDKIVAYSESKGY